MIKFTNSPKAGQKIILLLIFIAIFTGGDLWVKEIAKQNLKNKADLVVIPGFWSFQYAENDDLGFSMLRFLNSLFSRTGKFFLIVILQSIGTIIAITFYFYLNKWKYCIPLILIICGGLGNLLDRILRGYVIDYVKWYIGNFIWPIFNLADVYTVIGSFSLGIILFFFSNEIKKESTTSNNKQE